MPVSESKTIRTEINNNRNRLLSIGMITKPIQKQLQKKLCNLFFRMHNIFKKKNNKFYKVNANTRKSVQLTVTILAGTVVSLP